MLYITGCPRSGTFYIANYLKLMGVKVEHEKMGEDGTVDWMRASTKLEGIIIHQVRNPIDCISSLSCISRVMKRNMFQHLNIDCTNQPLINICMLIWYHWNILVEQQAQYRQRIEDFDYQKLKELAVLSGATPNDTKPYVPLNRWNTRKNRHYTWKKLFIADYELTKKIRDKAIEYGYKII